MINTSPPSAADFKQRQQLPNLVNHVNGNNGLSNGVNAPGAPMSPSSHRLQVQQASADKDEVIPSSLEKDYYGCYCLKFIVKNGTHITEEKVLEDFGQFGEVVDVRGPGLFSGLRGNHVYVRFIEKIDAEEALRHLHVKYHQLTPASISDVLPDNYGLYTISFYNKTGIPSAEVRREFSNFGEVKNLTGSLDVKGGRVFVSYKEKSSAVQALQAFFFRKEKYPNMKFALPRCEKDYFGCYCLKFYNKSGDITEEKVLRDFGQFGDVVDVRGPGLFDVTGDDVYVRYKEKSSAEQALVELVGKYDSLCLAPPSDIQADKFGYFTITFVNDKCLSKSDVWYIFSKFGTVACVNGTFDCKKGRVFVSYKDKQGALNALETMLITKEYHLQVSKNSTVRKNDYNVVAGGKDHMDANEYESSSANGQSNSSSTPSSSNNSSKSNGILLSNGHHPHHDPELIHIQRHNRDHSRSREPSLVPVPSQLSQQHLHQSMHQVQAVQQASVQQAVAQAAVVAAVTQAALAPVVQQPPVQQQQPPTLSSLSDKMIVLQKNNGGGNGLVKFNRNVEKDIFGYFCLSFLNEDGDINEKKVRHDFGKFGEVVSVRGALGKQKGHVFVRFRRKEAAENCLNCLNSFPLSEMSELFGKYLYLSPATPRDIDCDMYGLYSISFLNLNMKSFREIRMEFAKFGEIVRLTSGGSGNTDELVSISYNDKAAAIKALQTHFTNKEFPYLDIAKGSSLLLVNSSDSSDNEDNVVEAALEGFGSVHHVQQPQQRHFNEMPVQLPLMSQQRNDPFHDPSPIKTGPSGSDVVDELLKPFQSYFSIYRTGQYHNPLGAAGSENDSFANATPVTSSSSPSSQQPQKQPQTPSSTSVALQNQQCSQQLQRSPDKKYRTKSMAKQQPSNNGSLSSVNEPQVTSDLVLNGSSIVTEETKNDQDQDSNEPCEPVSEPVEADQKREIGPLELDVFGHYSLTFVNKAKDLSERKVRLDFSKYGEVARVRGQFNSSSSMGESIIVSFSDKESAERAVSSPSMASKYGPSLNTCPFMDVIPDKDGHYSVEFVNSGMSGIREITNEFSKHGEVMKVMAGGGAKNAVKKVTVSFVDRQAAFNAVKAHETSKDFVSIDFSRDCLTANSASWWSVPA